MNLFESYRQLGGGPARFLVIGSSEEYGLVYPDELPVRETNPLRPLSPYAVSKVTQDLLGYQYWKSYGLDIVRTRAFHHTGPRRGDAFSTSSFAKQIAEVEAGLREPVIHVGDLNPTRDFSDVRDIVRGYWALLERGTAGEVYNLCSGVDWSIERMLNFLIAHSKLERIEIRSDPARLRPSDVPVLRGSADKIREAVGWTPSIPLEQTLLDLLDYWRQQIERQQR
jgi:GDP-4-dehydro-6-deoxy-D-mannose reductase